MRIHSSIWPISMCEYHTSRVPSSAALLMPSRYSLAPARTTLRRSARENPRSRPGNLEAGRQALHIPLPGAGKCLVKVVDVEDQAALGRAEHPEVGQMGVTAALHGDARVRRGGQIVGHDQRRTAEEGEGRDQHAPIPDGNQFGHPRGRLLLEEIDRIGPAGGGPPVPVGGTRCLTARRTCPGPPAPGGSDGGSSAPTSAEGPGRVAGHRRPSGAHYRSKCGWSLPRGVASGVAGSPVESQLGRRWSRSWVAGGVAAGSPVESPVGRRWSRRWVAGGWPVESQVVRRSTGRIPDPAVADRTPPALLGSVRSACSRPPRLAVSRDPNPAGQRPG